MTERTNAQLVADAQKLRADMIRSFFARLFGARTNGALARAH